MLLVIDVGNTNIVFGVFEKNKLLGDWRINTNIHMTRDELNMFVSHMFSGIDLSSEKISKVVISSVVPAMANVLSGFCQQFFNCMPHWVDVNSLGKMPHKYTNPKEVGSDRIVNVVAAYEKYKTSLIVIDMGTATTFDAVSEIGEYLGGAISPGLFTAANALYQSAPRLPRVELSKQPDTVIGIDTMGSLQSGIIFGYAGLVDGVVNRMRAEMVGKPIIIATGGLSQLMRNISQTIESIEPDLTLHGLRIIGDSIGSF